MNEACALFYACEAVSAAVLRRGNVVGDMADSQIKSRERVSKRGEVFTAKREVNAMLDLVKHETGGERHARSRQARDRAP